ncbi:helix-turn-helix domain-containing protein [Streptomyces sp. MUM 178J]|uniref:helix-turn-helix domain-containing protein n=1 Tax=Streptomyces sp. MUM 178J TaxID=2791991 RepID=UPI001F041EEB|nr:helix-turn-helix domain-containing protein [Streptomyces sp. MUM 178J]WRQ80460.1 helix-turn-helix domain-containing protein [Streptomyces sp. MUM 178J]
MYAERASRLAGAVVWTAVRDSRTADRALPVLPDGCMDLIWADGRLLVAGPDTRAHRPDPALGERFAGVRFAPGTGPLFLGVPAHELRDLRTDLSELSGAAEAGRLAARVGRAADPAAELEAEALRRAAAAGPPDPLTGAVVRLLEAGGTVAAAAEEVGLGARQLHRRCLDAFGYGPKTLARVLRLQRALRLVRLGAPFVDAAAASGCADQAHLAREMRDLAGMTLGTYAESAKSETSPPSGSSTTA